jgi:hypothetical protein
MFIVFREAWKLGWRPWSKQRLEIRQTIPLECYGGLVVVWDFIEPAKKEGE